MLLSDFPEPFPSKFGWIVQDDDKDNSTETVNQICGILKQPGIGFKSVDPL